MLCEPVNTSSGVHKVKLAHFVHPREVTPSPPRKKNRGGGRGREGKGKEEGEKYTITQIHSQLIEPHTAMCYDIHLKMT